MSRRFVTVVDRCPPPDSVPFNCERAAIHKAGTARPCVLMRMVDLRRAGNFARYTCSGHFKSSAHCRSCPMLVLIPPQTITATILAFPRLA